MFASPPIKIINMGSYYAGSMINASYIWVLMIMRMGVFIGCGYGSETGIAASTLHIKQL
jgi:hypothetical protein